MGGDSEDDIRGYEGHRRRCRRTHRTGFHAAVAISGRSHRRRRALIAVLMLRALAAVLVCARGLNGSVMGAVRLARSGRDHELHGHALRPSCRTRDKRKREKHSQSLADNAAHRVMLAAVAQARQQIFWPALPHMDAPAQSLQACAAAAGRGCLSRIHRAGRNVVGPFAAGRFGRIAQHAAQFVAGRLIFL